MACSSPASYTLSKSTDTNSYDGTALTTVAAEQLRPRRQRRAVGLRRPAPLQRQRHLRAAVPRQPAEGRLAGRRRRAGAVRAARSTSSRTSTPSPASRRCGPIWSVRCRRSPEPIIDANGPGQLPVVRRPTPSAIRASPRRRAGSCTSTSVFALPVQRGRRRALRQPAAQRDLSDRASATSTSRSSRT